MKKIIFTLLVLLVSVSLNAEIKLPKIIGSNMVLQRNSEVNLWGAASPNTKVEVKVSWNKKSYTTTSDAQGAWLVKVATPDVSRDQSITISDGSKINISNVMIGDVWICSGQSNMEMPVMGFGSQPTEHSYQTILDADKQSNIRMFTVGKNSVAEPQEDCKTGEWMVASAGNVTYFSAVGYFFGKALSDALDIPIGLINTSWGGSNIETWISEKAIDTTPNINLKAAKSGNSDNSRLSHLYNGMIKPITNFTAKGFIWYQGESNRGRHNDYDKLMVTMVDLWRKDWNNDKMPFYFVQLAPYNYGNPNDPGTGYLIEAQYRANKAIPYSGVAATTDIGHPTCIHPPKKKEVGERLAFLALRNDYGKTAYPNPAPTYKSMTIAESTVTLQFNNLDYRNCFERYNNEGTVTLTGFEIAGEDKVFYPAKANLKNNNVEIEVSSAQVANPVAVRYAFKNFTQSNVCTMWKQPLAPFRTDSW